MDMILRHRGVGASGPALDSALVWSALVRHKLAGVHAAVADANLPATRAWLRLHHSMSRM